MSQSKRTMLFVWVECERVVRWCVAASWCSNLTGWYYFYFAQSKFISLFNIIGSSRLVSQLGLLRKKKECNWVCTEIHARICRVGKYFVVAEVRTGECEMSLKRSCKPWNSRLLLSVYFFLYRFSHRSSWLLHVGLIHGYSQSISFTPWPPPMYQSATASAIVCSVKKNEIEIKTN